MISTGKLQGGHTRGGRGKGEASQRSVEGR
jgi:hypothetical protein